MTTMMRGPKNMLQHCRRRLLVLALCGSTLVLCSAFCPKILYSIRKLSANHQRKEIIRNGAVLNDTIGSESNFWFTVTRKDDIAADRGPGFNPQWPVVPSLDIDGPLPPASYNYFGKEECQPKPTCAIGISVDFERFDAASDGIVEGMQQFIDHGFTTFHLGLPTPSRIKESGTGRDQNLWLPSPHQSWGESHVYGRLQKSTPASVLHTCNLVVPIMTPPAETSVNRILVREAVTQSLGRMGTDCIDTLEVQYCDGSPYHLDMMEYLVDLQRDGLIRTISGRNFPTTQLRTLEGCGFHLDCHHRSYNLSTDKNMIEYQLAASDLNAPNLLSSPLAGGLLTDRFLGRVFPPLESQVGAAKSKQFTQTLQSWARMQQQEGGKGNLPVHYLLAWERYQKFLLPQLQDIARKYQVSIASVALRWILQMKQTGGTIVSCDLKNDADIGRDCSRRIKSLRDTFRFELDDEDLRSTREVAGIVLESLNTHEGYDDLDLNGLMNNPKLFL